MGTKKANGRWYCGSQLRVQFVRRRSMLWKSLALFPLLALMAPAHAVSFETDRRVFTRIVHRAVVPREISVYAELPSPGRGAPLVPLWSGLGLRLLPLRHQGVERGVFAYSLQLLSKELGDQPVLPTNQPRHGITADVIAAFHFRNRDNSGPNAPGPLNVNAPAEFRVLRYPTLTLEVRVLAFEILNARPGLVPSFSSLRLLITAREASATAERPVRLGGVK
jgi:hypothetical protein